MPARSPSNERLLKNQSLLGTPTPRVTLASTSKMTCAEVFSAGWGSFVGDESRKEVVESMQSVVPDEAAATRRREAILLLILASVQFTSIVDFMVVMPLGPKLEPELGIDALSVRLDRSVIYSRARVWRGFWAPRSWTDSAARPRS